MTDVMDNTAADDPTNVFDAFAKRSGFRDTSLSAGARNRLGAIAEAQARHPNQRCELLKIILANAYDPDRGLYMPLSVRPNIPQYFTKDIDNLPSSVDSVQGWSHTHFLNALLLPTGGDSPPRSRPTNAGVLIVTHEFDSKTNEQFEETLNWSLDDGPFGALHRELKQYKDYRGYSIVFSGRRSLHFHFLFDTRHLIESPFNALHEKRLAQQAAQCAVMTKAHRLYWDLVDSLIVELLRPSHYSDRALQYITQWRRTPFARRVLERPSDILNLSAGAMVPQFVIKEAIVTRAAPGSDKWVVDKYLSASSPLHAMSSRAFDGIQRGSLGQGSMFVEADGILRASWGDFPRLRSIEPADKDWGFRFFNHANDVRPGTYVRGGYQKLELVGGNVPTGPFFLPDGMTANEFGEYLALLCGNPILEPILDLPCPETPSASVRTSEPLPVIQRLKMHSERNRGIPFSKQWATKIEDEWPLPMMELSSSAQRQYRDKLRCAFRTSDQYSVDCDWIVMSTEGIGKTTTLMKNIAERAFFLTLDNGRFQFSVVACRSLDQAKAKAEEALERTELKVIIVQSFWKYYEETCKAEGVRPLPKNLFDDRSVNGILGQIKAEQPAVFDHLERIRHSLWSDGIIFDSMQTMIFTTHATASTWRHSQITRAWHHPEFEPFLPKEDIDRLRNEFVFGNVVVDEFEIDEILNVLPDRIYDHLRDQHESIDWKHLTTSAQYEVYEKARQDGIFGDQVVTFESYSDLMRIDLDTLYKLTVDFDQIPFGHDNKTDAEGCKSGIYQDKNGMIVYVGPKAWIKDRGTRWTFLTTETLVTDLLERVYTKLRKPVLVLRLDNMPGIYPIQIPLFVDPRAAADRAGKLKITAIANEILAGNENAVVVGDGIAGGGPRTMSFQKMKGRNDLADRDVFVILTHLVPELYAKLNVIGQWLGMPDIIHQHYQGLINQAVGRNRGFRQQDGTKTVVICSDRLWQPVISKQARNPRIRLYRVGPRPW